MAGSHQKGAVLVEVYHGDCDVVADLNLWSHLAINVLSTLGAVNPAAIISGWNIGDDGSASDKILALILVANLP
jgi:hypothetical protein